MTQENNKEHKHSELIHAWADGAKIQRFDGDRWRNEKHPSWDDDEEYRVRPDGTPWQPEYKDKYFIVDENFEPSEEVWDDCDFDDAQYERGNCFRTFEEAEAAAERVRAALKGEESEKLVALGEPERLKKLRAIKTIIEEETSCTASEYFHCHAILSDREAALIRAIRKVKAAHGDILDHNAIREVLNAILREQEQEANND